MKKKPLNSPTSFRLLRQRNSGSIGRQKTRDFMNLLGKFPRVHFIQCIGL